jgi:serine/threonine protein kinase
MSRNSKELIRKNRECRIVFNKCSWIHYSRECINFVLELTEPDPALRPTAAEALKNPWLQEDFTSRPTLQSVLSEISLKETFLSQTMMRRLIQTKPDSSLYLESLASSTQGEAVPMHHIERVSEVKQLKALKLFRQLRLSDAADELRLIVEIPEQLAFSEDQVVPGSVELKELVKVMIVKAPGTCFNAE